MFKLKLIKSRSYTGHGVSVSSANPFIEVSDKEKSDALAASGYFSVVSEDALERSHKEKAFDKMNDKELDAYAAENGIDISGANKKSEKLAIIRQALADASASEDFFGDK